MPRDAELFDVACFVPEPECTVHNHVGQGGDLEGNVVSIGSVPPHPKSELVLKSDSNSKGLLAVVSCRCPHHLQKIALDKVTVIVLNRVHSFVQGYYSVVVVKQVVPFDLSQNRSVLVPMDLDPALVDVVGSPLPTPSSNLVPMRPTLGSFNSLLKWFGT